MEKVENDSGLITLHLISGSMIKSNQKKQGKLEFRQIKGTRLVIVHLYDYIPKLLWPIYYFVQAPLQGLIMRGFEIDCRIKHFNGRVQSGKNEIYKIIGDKVMQVLLVEDDQTLFQELKKN